MVFGNVFSQPWTKRIRSFFCRATNVRSKYPVQKRQLSYSIADAFIFFAWKMIKAGRCQTSEAGRVYLLTYKECLPTHFCKCKSVFVPSVRSGEETYAHNKCSLSCVQFGFTQQKWEFRSIIFRSRLEKSLEMKWRLTLPITPDSPTSIHGPLSTTLD